MSGFHNSPTEKSLHIVQKTYYWIFSESKYQGKREEKYSVMRLYKILTTILIYVFSKLLEDI